MKKLYLMRHAKSSWKKPLPDHERPLKKRGRKAAKEMGKALKKAGIFPDLILSSDALRAKQTALLVAEELGLPSEKIRLEPRLYEADLSQILHVIQNVENSVDSILLVAHNPGISEAAVALSREERFSWMKTAQIVGLAWDVEGWDRIEGKKGKVIFEAAPGRTPKR